MKKRTIALLCGCGLLAGIVINGSMAYLTSTDSVMNTFTAGNVAITLQENRFDNATKDYADEVISSDNRTEVGLNTYNFVPGETLKKNPWVTVDAGSEKCWLFIHVEESESNQPTGLDPMSGETVGKIINYKVDQDIWTPVKITVNDQGQVTTITKSGYYYYSGINAAETATAVSGVEYPILANNQITVNENMTKSMANEINTGTKEKPQLIFEAAAVQKMYVESLTDAWNALPEEFTNEPKPSN